MHEEAIAARLSAGIDRRGVDECWPWRGPFHSGGYGRLTVHGVNLYAHRAIYEHEVGPIPDGHHVCHHCDNRPCCNPAHLFTGTNDDNIADKVAKQRQPRGSGHGQHKLTERDVDTIRALLARGETRRTIGDRFGVSSFAITDIALGRTWGWYVSPR
jgi:hypothetical protein